MPGACCLAWMFTVLGAGQTTDFAAGADLNTQAGIISVQPDTNSTPGVQSTLTLLSGIRIRSARSSLSVRYVPQFYYQVPNVADVNRPLLLQRADATFSTHLSERVNFGFSTEGVIGDLSYSNLSTGFDQGTSALGTGIVPLFYVTATGNLSYQSAPRNTVSVFGGSTYRTTLDSDPDQPGGVPTSQDWTIGLSDSYRLSLRDEVGASASAIYVYRPSLDTLTGTSLEDSLNFTMDLSWQRSLSPRSDLSLRGGAAASKSELTGEIRFFPTALMTHSFRARSMGSVWANQLSAGMIGMLDPLLATYRPNASLIWGLTGRHSDYWSSSTSLSFSIPVAKPIVPSQYETNASFNLTLNYRTRTGLDVRFGAQSSLRAANPADLGALIPTVEATGFLGVRYTLGTSTENGSWL